MEIIWRDNIQVQYTSYVNVFPHQIFYHIDS